MNSNDGKQKFYLIYKITNLLDNRIYIGAHCTFNVNDKYMGSSKHLKKDIKELGKQNFKKEILHIFSNKEDMIKKEAEIVNKEFCYRIDTYNKMIGGISELSWNDMIVVKDNCGTIHSVYKDDPRYLSGEFVGIAKGIPYNKGKLNVRDANGNTFQVDVADPRWLSGELVHLSTGKPGTKSLLGKNHSEESKNKIGLANSEKQKGEANSQFGTCWVTNGTENKKIKKEQLEEFIVKGFYKGRK